MATHYSKDTLEENDNHNFSLRRFFFNKVVLGVYDVNVTRNSLKEEINKLGRDSWGRDLNDEDKRFLSLGDEIDQEYGTNGIVRLYLCPFETIDTIRHPFKFYCGCSEHDLASCYADFGFKTVDPITLLAFVNQYARKFPLATYVKRDSLDGIYTSCFSTSWKFKENYHTLSYIHTIKSQILCFRKREISDDCPLDLYYGRQINNILLTLDERLVPK